MSDDNKIILSGGNVADLSTVVAQFQGLGYRCVGEPYVKDGVHFQEMELPPEGSK